MREELEELKKQCKDGVSYIEAVKKLESDSIKIEAVAEMKSEYSKALIINSLKSDENKIKAINLLKNDLEKTIVIEGIKSDEIKIQMLDELQSEEIKSYVIERFINDDNYKIEGLNKLSNDYYIANVIISLNSDENRINKIEEIDLLNKVEEYTKTRIIRSFNSDEIKMKMIDLLKLDSLKCDVIESFNNDENKIKMLDTLKENKHKMKIIMSFKEDKNKIKVLNCLTEIEKTEVAIGFKDDASKLEILNGLSKKYKIVTAISLKDEKKKIEILKEFIESNDINTDLGLPPQMTLGIEIEAEYISEDEDLGDLLDKQKLKEWNFKCDWSLENGIEVVSPIMHNNEKDLKKIPIIASLLNAMEFSITNSCGGHVHIGADYLESTDDFMELLELWENAEKIFYLISNKPGELPREGIDKYAAPISSKIEKNKIKKDEFVEEIKKIQEKRNRDINFMNVNTKKNTIEFRLSNGTIDSNTWIENIRLYGRVVQMAHEISEIKKKLIQGEQITEEELQKIIHEIILKKSTSLDKKKDALMGILFNEEERQPYEERYKINKELEKEKGVIKELKIRNIEFDIEDYRQICENTLIPQNIKELLLENEDIDKKANNQDEKDIRY